MDKFTKEQQVQAVYDLKVGYTLGHADIAMLKSMARQLLASMEQEPVAYMHHSGQVVTRGECCDDKIFAICCKVETPLYAAPQLPQPAPEALKCLRSIVADPKTLPRRKEWISGQQYSYVLLESVEAMVDDVCRAAMPQAGNSPVIPDGWVACSERMPDIGVKVLCFPVNDEPIHATYNGQLWLQDISWSVSDESIDNVISCNVFHWMPLPAAPQQEVNP